MSHKIVILLRIFLISALYSAITITTAYAQKKETITFPSKDGLIITADLYMPNPINSPFILLFHQAGWSRGEYLEIAPKLNDMGFNCMAVDQRSGSEVNGIKNQTKIEADKLNKPTEYMDAMQDLEAAIEYISEKYSNSKLIIWGSSYSSSFVLKITGDNPDNISGVLSFSPAEYSKYFGTSPTFIKDSAKNIKCPVFITASRVEAELWQDIYDVIPSNSKHSFIPDTEGNHGSRALWEQFPESENYWAAVSTFLNKYFLNNTSAER